MKRVNKSAMNIEGANTPALVKLVKAATAELGYRAAKKSDKEICKIYLVEVSPTQHMIFCEASFGHAELATTTANKLERSLTWAEVEVKPPSSTDSPSYSWKLRQAEPGRAMELLDTEEGDADEDSGFSGSLSEIADQLFDAIFEQARGESRLELSLAKDSESEDADVQRLVDLARAGAKLSRAEMYGQPCILVVLSDGSREYRFLKAPQIEQLERLGRLGH